jgi:hypothetical protein
MGSINLHLNFFIGCIRPYRFLLILIIVLVAAIEFGPSSNPGLAKYAPQFPVNLKIRMRDSVTGRGVQAGLKSSLKSRAAAVLSTDGRRP